MDDITHLLRQAASGKKHILDQVLPLVEAELNEIASRYMARQRRDHTLQATALVNEAYVRLANQGGVSYKDRAHFISVAAKKMREILLDHSKRRGASKRPESRKKEPLASVVVSIADRTIDAIALCEALERLQRLDETLYEVVTLKLIGGMKTAEIAAARDVTPRTIQLQLKEATMVLLAELDRGED